MKQLGNLRGFSLLEVLVAITLFALIVTAAAGNFAAIQAAWRKQKNAIDLVQNARWAIEFMANEIRRARTISIALNGAGTRLTFQFDPDANGFPPFRTVRYERSGNTLRRRQIAGPPTPWQELTNLMVADALNNTTGLPPPDGIPDRIFNNVGSLLSIQCTLRPRPAVAAGPNNRNYTLRTQVRVKN